MYTQPPGCTRHDTLLPTRRSSDLHFDPLKDLAPIGQTSWGSLLLVTHPSNPANTVADGIRAAQAAPGKLTYGTPGVSTPHHLSMALFLDRTHSRMLHVDRKSVV